MIGVNQLERYLKESELSLVRATALARQYPDEPWRLWAQSFYGRVACLRRMLTDRTAPAHGDAR